MTNETGSLSDALWDEIGALRKGKAESDAAVERLQREASDLAAHVTTLSNELAATRKAKAENDERFMRERDEARAAESRANDYAHLYADVIWRLLTPETLERSGFGDVAASMRRAEGKAAAETRRMLS